MEIHNKSILDPRMQLWNLLKTFWRMLNEKSRTFYLEDGFLESMIAHIEEKFLERCGIQFSSLKILKNKDPYLLDTFSKLEFILEFPICDQSYFQSLFEQFWVKIRNAVCAYDKRFQVRITDSRGFSVFALENIPKRTLIGVYHGYYVSAFRLDSALSSFAGNDENSSSHYIKHDNFHYLVPISGLPLYYVDPTLCTDLLLPEFDHCIVTKINEPPKGFSQNCYWVRKKRKPPEIWSIRDIQFGEELFIYYGSGYQRDYEIDGNCEFLCEDEEEEELKLRYKNLIN